MARPREKNYPLEDAGVTVHVMGSHRMVESHPAPNVTTRSIPYHDEREEKHKPSFLEVWWPILLGALLAAMAEQLRSDVLNNWGPVGERLLFPWVLLAARLDLRIIDASMLSKLVLQLQFPLTGLYATWKLSRNHKLSSTILQLLLVYGIAALMLWLLARHGASLRL
ncbi:MAG TPA: hypothetical protein VKB38_19035 [Terracidiphilus sp.]|nr:hypothetical protein [Terracidiphilus sp.]